MTYQVLRNNGRFIGVLREDGAQIPADARNADYQDFLTWNAAQATPLDTSDQPAPDINLTQRAEAVSRLASPDSFAKLVRAVALVLLDEVNTLRAAAGLQARTAAQMKNAIVSKLGGGSVD